MGPRAHAFLAFVAALTFVFIARMLRRRQLKAKYAVLWLGIGVAMMLLALFPGLIDTLSAWIGISYGPATLFLGGLVVLLLIAVEFSWELSRLEERSRRLAEELALLKVSPPRDSSSDDNPRSEQEERAGTERAAPTE